MATEVDTDALRHLAKKIAACAPKEPTRAYNLSPEATGHADLASAIAAFESRGTEAVAKLNSDGTTMSSGLDSVASIYEIADQSAEQATRDLSREWKK